MTALATMTNSNVIKWTFLDGVEPLKKKAEINPMVIEPLNLSLKEKVQDHLFRHQKTYVTSGMLLSSLAYPLTGLAASDAGVSVGGMSLVMLLQKASFYLGMGVVIWGIVESMLDFPGWKGRVTKGLIGYIAILYVPIVFMEIRNSIQGDVWSQLQGGR